MSKWLEFFVKKLENFGENKPPRFSMFSTVAQPFKKLLSSLLIFAVCAPSFSPVMAAPFWEAWTTDSAIESRAPEIKRTKLVSVLVEEELLEDSRLSTRIERFAMDVQREIEGQVVFVPVSKDATAFELWLGNSQLYFSGFNNDHQSQLVGTILIGELPIPVVNKNGRLHPTPWPLVDFEDPMYHWDTNSERFVWKSGGDEKAEIWHGVIRSDSSSEEGRNKEYRAFFDRNHRVHLGEEEFGKKVFVADLPQQKIGITADQRKTYENWINHLDDFSYLRYNKNLAKTLFEDLNPTKDVPMVLLPEEAQDVDTNADFSAMPDVMSKFVIEKMAQQYISSAREKLVAMLEPAMYTGRWEANDFDSTISLIAKKDEWAAKLLREANDEVENIFRDKLEDDSLDIAADVYLESAFHYQPYHDHWVDATEHHYYPVGGGIRRERYHNGLDVDDFDRWYWDMEDMEMKRSYYTGHVKYPAQNCTLVRGSVPDADHPAAQMVEFNRAYNFATAELDDDECLDWEDASDWEKDRDPYEGCCAKNLEIDEETFEMSVPDCTVNGGWERVPCVPAGDWECGLEIPDGSSFPSWSYWYFGDYDYIGATRPVFDINGARAVDGGAIGAQGCDDFIGVNGSSYYGQVRISSLMFHDEPRLETLQAQAKNQSVTSMPADDPRGASFYDHAEGFHRINFPSSFDFIHEAKDVADKDLRRQAVKAALDAELQGAVDSVTSTVGNSGKMDLDLFRTTLWGNEMRQQELLDAILWLGTDLEEKHVEMLRGALSDTADGARELRDDNFDGYEVIEIIAKPADDGLQLAFEKGESEPSNVFTEAQRESGEFNLEMLKSIDSGKSIDAQKASLPEGWESGGEDESSDDGGGGECSGVDLLTWPTKCLMPWIKELPDSMGGVIPIKPGDESLPAEVDLVLAGNKKTPQEVGEIVVSPSEIILSANDVMPITVSVDLKNKKGGVMETPVDVSITSDSNDADKFLSVSPASKRQAIAGRTQFSLIPKTSDVGGKFSFKLVAGDVVTEIPVTVTRAELSMSVATTEVVAGETAEVEVGVDVTNLSGEIINDMDGKWLEFSSDMGSFPGDGKFQIDNGGVKLLFTPSTSAGSGKITVRDEEGLLPVGEVDFEILPADADHVVLEGPDVLLLNADEVEVSAMVVDRYENEVNKVTEIEWDLPRGAKEQGGLAKVVAGTEEEVSVSAEIKGLDDSGDKKSFPVVVEPRLSAELSRDSVQAGENETIIVDITADKEIPGEFELTILNDKGIGLAEEFVSLVDGSAQIEILPGVRAGLGLISLQAPGFIGTSFSFEVEAGEPKKIDLSMDKSVIKLADDTATEKISIRVLDQFGNTVPTYGDPISLIQNPSEKWSSEDIDALEEVGVFDSSSPVKLYLEQNLVDTQMTTDNVVKFSPSEPRISRYVRDIEIETQGRAGMVYLVASAPGLVSDVLEFEVIDTIEQDEFGGSLVPKSLLTLLLGNDGGSFAKQNFGNRFLFDGKTQAVATLLVNESDKKQLYSFDPSGEMLGVEEVVFVPGNEFRFTIDGLVRASIKSVGSNISVQNSSRIDAGWNFIPTDGAFYKQEDNSLLREEEEILVVYGGGGMRFASGIEVLATNSWKEWIVESEDGELGMLVLGMDSGGAFFEQAAGAGVYLETISPRVELKEALTGKALNSPRGVAVFDREELESSSKWLGSSKISAEDAGMIGGVSWTTEWKPGTLFAAGNMAGVSVQHSSSDAMVLLGDPTVKIKSENAKSDLGITKDMGEILWSTSFGAVDEILVADLNSDGRADIMPRVGNELHILYQARHQMDNFRDTGVLLRFADGVEKLAIHEDSLGNLLHIIQLNEDGKLVFHKNVNGTLQREYIDLGLDNKVVNFDVVNLNSDEDSDLILLDSHNTIYFAYGHDEEWYAAQLAESFSARFNDVMERYDAGVEQGSQNLRVDSFEQLESFYARFDGVEVASWTDTLRVINNEDFVAISDNKRFNAFYKASAEDSDTGDSGNGAVLVPGTAVNHFLNIYGNSGVLSDFEVVVPQGVGFVVDENSFKCDGCTDELEVQVGKKSTLLRVGDVPVLANLTLRWETKAEDVPQIRYMVRDFTGKDGVDDVAVAWQPEGEPAQAIQLLSTGAGTIPARTAEATVDVARSPFLRTHRKVQSEIFPEVIPADFDAAGTADAVMECMGEQKTSSGTPTMFISQSASEAQDSALSGFKRPSWLDYIPSIAIFAPGPQSLYISPFAIPLPLPWTMGLPTLQIITSIPFVTPPFIPPVTPISMFRLYVMPTTSLKLGLAICGGPVIDPTMSPKPVPFPPQCFVVIPQFSFGGGGGSSSTATVSAGTGAGDEVVQSSCFDLEPANEASPQQELMQQLFATGGDGKPSVSFSMGAPFSIVPAMKPTNRTIKAADVLGMWVQAQWRELTNFKFPRFSLKLPKFPKSTSSKDDSALEKLKKSPFIDVKTKKITISYPEISTKNIEQLGKNIKGWKVRAKEKIEDTTNQWSTASCENLQGGDWNKNTKKCEKDPNAASAMNLLSEISKIKSEGTKLRLRSTPLTMTRKNLVDEKKKIGKDNEKDLEKARDFEADSSDEYEARIEELENEVQEIMDSSDLEKNEEMLEEVRGISDELEELLEELNALRSDVAKLRVAEFKAIVSDKLENTLRKLKGYQLDMAGDITAVETLGPEVEELKIAGKNAVIDVYVAKLEGTYESPEEAKSKKEQREERRAARKKEREEKAAARKEKRAEKAEERKAKRAERKAERKAKREEARAKMKEEMQAVFEEVAVDPIKKKWREFENAVDKNVEALKSYPRAVKQLKEIPKKLKKLLDQITGMADVINEYWAEWIDRNQRAIDKWIEFGEEAKKAIAAWADIPNILKKFGEATSSANGGSMSRGSLMSWLKNLMLSAIKFPVIPMPQVPDVEIDLSGVKIGMLVEVPQLEFTPVEVAPGALPVIPNLELRAQFLDAFLALLQNMWKQQDLSLENLLDMILQRILAGDMTLEELLALLQNLPDIQDLDALKDLLASLLGIVEGAENLIPTIPVLPEAPTLPDASLELPPLLLPTLPSLIEPPKFPDFLKVPNLLMMVPKALLGLLAMLSKGLMPVPEWYVGTAVVNATNRTLLLPIDFLGKLPMAPKIVLPPIKIKLAWEFVVALPSLVSNLEAIAATFNVVTAQISNAAKGLPVAMHEEEIKEDVEARTFAVETVDLLPNFDSPMFAGEYGDYEAPRPRMMAAKVPDVLLAGKRNWQASSGTTYIQTSDFPQEVPGAVFTDPDVEDKDVEDIPEVEIPPQDEWMDQAGDLAETVPNADSAPVVIPRIIWFDSEKEKAESVIDFPLSGERYAYTFADLDRDGMDEIFYSIGGQLFMKRLRMPRLTAEEQDMEFDTPDNFIRWDFETFSSGLVPAEDYGSAVKPNGAKFEFLPAKTNDTSYFEWVISDRPDRVFETLTDSEDRASKLWRRVGFLIRPPAASYEIRPVGAQITSVEGAPVMYGTPLEKVKKMETSDCSDPDAVLPFFAEETIFVGKAARSRLLIRTLAREGQVADEREIELREGEETVVDFAEVCMTRGEVDYLAFGDVQKLVPEEKDYFFSGMRLELGAGDEVLLDIYDETKIKVSGGERYELHQFESREEMINSFKEFDYGNWYGQFAAFKGDQSSWTRSNDLLHDPQPADDKTPPRIKLRRGIKRSVSMGQKIEIDATRTVEKKGIYRVWWEARGKVLIDSAMTDYSPMELLKVLLPAENTPSTFDVTLHVIDMSGNEAVEDIEVSVVNPRLELMEVSTRDALIKGRIEGNLKDVEVRFLRERNGREEIISRSAITDKDGGFEVKDLSRSGGVLLNDENTGDTKAEILANGRPVVLSDDLLPRVYTATDLNPLQVELTVPSGASAATISFVAPETDLEIPYGLGRDMKSEELQIVDYLEDDVEWREAAYGNAELWNTTTGGVLGLIDNQGQFRKRDASVFLQLSEVADESEPMAFDVLYARKKVAEIIFPSFKEISVK